MQNSSLSPQVRTAAQLVAAVVRELRWGVAASALLALALAFAEGAGLVLLVPLLGSIGLAVSEGPTRGMAAAVQSIFTAAGLELNLVTVVAVFVSVSVGHAILYRAHLLLNPTLEQRFALALRQRLYAAIVRMDWSLFASRRSSEFVHAVTTDVDRAASAVYQLLTLVASLAVSAVYLAVAVKLSPGLTAVVATAGLAMLWGLRRRTRRVGELGEDYAQANRRQFHLASESIAGLKVAKSFGAEQRDIAIFAGLARKRAEAYIELIRGFARSKMRIDLSSALLISALLLIAVEWLGVRGAGLLMLVFVFSRVMPRVMSLQESMQLVVAGLPSFRVVSEMAEECEARTEHVPASTAERIRLLREIRLDDVSYSYPGGVALDRVALSIAAGRRIALVGVSGAGKSTVADLLIGLLRPSGGAIVVDGRPLADADIAAWRRSVGYVPQESFLLHDTVRANLLWARPGATDGEMWAALEGAAAAEFVRTKPDGLDTVVGDRGVNLSGGERQRLALARALLTGPDLLILDEATSALDALNEQKILSAVAQLAGQVTTIVITHRLSAVRSADHIYVLDCGKIVESGQWQELMTREGVFAALVAAQDLQSPAVGNQREGEFAAANRAAI